MGQQIRVGDSVPLSLQLFDSDETKFVRAIVRDQTGAAVAGSPQSMPHQTDGRYENFDLLMPANTSVLLVSYQVFNDSGFTTKSPDHSDTADDFGLLVIDQDLIDKLIEIRDLLDQVISSGISVVGANLFGTINDDQEFVAEIAFQQTAQGEIDDDNAATGGIDDDGVTGAIDDGDVAGEVEC